MIKEVNKKEFKEEIEKSDIVLVDFFATWCPPCKELSPIIEKFAEENPNIKVLKVNIDNEQELSIEYGVIKVPTLIVFKNNKETARSIGVISKEKITKMI